MRGECLTSGTSRSADTEPRAIGREAFVRHPEDYMAKREYTVGVIGLGFGRSHIPAFQVNGCRVVAVCQRHREQAQAIDDRYGI